MKRIGTRVANRGKKHRELLPERVRGLASKPVGCRFNSSVPHYFQPRFSTWFDVSGLHSRRFAHQMKRNWDVIFLTSSIQLSSIVSEAAWDISRGVFVWGFVVRFI